MAVPPPGLHCHLMPPKNLEFSGLLCYYYLWSFLCYYYYYYYYYLLVVYSVQQWMILIFVLQMQDHNEKECPTAELKCPFNVVGCQFEVQQAFIFFLCYIWHAALL